MTIALCWTRKLPTKEGWYWWRAVKKNEPFVVHLGMTVRSCDIQESLCTDYCEDQETPEELGGEWKGPITP